MKTKNIRSLIFILLGNALLACGVRIFLLPQGFVSGGSTGISIFIEHLTGIPIPLSVLALNTLFFLAGLYTLGKHFAAATLVSTFFYPFCLNLLAALPQPAGIGEDMLLSAVYAGLLSGAGLGMVFRESASTGGTDIPILWLNRKKGLPLDLCLYIVDGAVILLQLPVSTPAGILYGILVMMISSFVISRVTLIGQAQVQLFIISPQYREIQDLLLRRLDTGVTLFHIENGLKRTPSQAILTVIPMRKLSDATQLILQKDETAFITIHEIKEVRGRGYSLER